MNEIFEQYYQNIGSDVLEVASESIGKILFYCEVEDGAMTSDIFYLTDKDKVKYKYANTKLKLYVYDFWEKWSSYPENQEWRAMTYVIEDGDFSVEFTYPDKIDIEAPYYERRPHIIERHFSNADVDYSNPK
jgi:hypothetical protein